MRKSTARMSSVAFMFSFVLNAQTPTAPLAVMDAFQKAYPSAKLKSVKPEKRKGKTVYELESLNGGHTLDVLFAAGGEIIEAEEGLSIAEIPAVVLASIKKRHPKAEVLSAEKLTAAAGTKFEIVIREAGQKREVVLDATGRAQ